MDNRTILVLQGAKGTPQELSPLVTAAEAIGGRLKILQVGEMPRVPAYAIEGYSMPMVWEESNKEKSDQLRKQEAATAAYLALEGVQAETGVIYDSTYDLGHRIVPHTFLADVAVITNDLRQSEEAFDNLSYSVILESPIPLILNPTENALSPKRVLIAWNDSLPAARAVHAALPMLKAAQEVTLAVIDPVKDHDDASISIAAWLSHHGCKVNVEQIPSAGRPIVDVLLRCAREDGDDLIVLGAYGHTRMRQRLFGGTTRSIIEQTTQAVFLAH